MTTAVIIGAIVLAVILFLVLRKKPEALPPSDAEIEKPARLADAQPRAAEPKPRAAEPKAKTEDKAVIKAEPEPTSKRVDPAPSAEATPAPPPRAKSIPDVEPPPPSRQSKTPKQVDVAGLRKGLAKSRDKEGFFGRLKAIFGGKKEIDPNLVEQIEEVLLTSDVGVKTTGELVSSLKADLEKNELADADKVWARLRQRATQLLSMGTGGLSLTASPTVVMVIGVNGVGKTTTIGKLATRYVQQGKKVVLAAGDTFRAAAVQQLVVWGKRAGCEVVSGEEGANAGAVIFDAIQKAKNIGADIVLADTAGRLHTKTNLMEELKKIQRTMTKAMDGAPHETLLVLDATNGQNALQQAALFKEALPISGIVLTKLDGTAKGGIVLGVCAEHGIAVRYIGIGERAEDLREFDAEEFVEALLGGAGENAEAA